MITVDKPEHIVVMLFFTTDSLHNCLDSALHRRRVLHFNYEYLANH